MGKDQSTGEFLDCPQMCIFFDGIDDDTDIVHCQLGHDHPSDEAKCFDNQCDDYVPDGVDMNLLCADILDVLYESGGVMTDDQITEKVLSRENQRRFNN